MNRCRIRFLERDYIFNRVRNNTKFLSDDEINRLLDQHEWNDYTFIFDIRDGYLKTVVIDNHSACDVALIDLNFNAREFYSQQIKEIKNDEYYINKCREILSKEAV